MYRHDIIVIGASAGGVEALKNLVHALPTRLPAAVFMVLHIPPNSPSMMPGILTRNGYLPATHPTDNSEPLPGHIYIAPPDHHMLLEEGRIRVVHGPKENRSRPAVDPLFRSAALAYGKRVVGIVLTGALDDGSAGLQAVKQRGGIAIVQDPKDALYPDMPLNAMAYTTPDYVVPLAEIGPLIVRLASEESSEEDIMDQQATDMQQMEKEVQLAELALDPSQHANHVGHPSVFSCPECGGVLWEMKDDDLLRFRCRVGHAFSIDSMFAEQADAIEEALWVALKTLSENAELARRMAAQARKNGHQWLTRRFEDRVKEAEHRVNLLKNALELGNVPSISLTDAEKNGSQPSKQ